VFEDSEEVPAFEGNVLPLVRRFAAVVACDRAP
jgi:hypothetical protein